MAAQPEDYFQEVGTPGSATYMTAPGYTIGATTMNVQSTSGFPSDTGVIFSVDTTSTVNGVETQDAGSYCVFEGKVASATSLSGVSLLYGTPQNYPAGATTRVYITVSTQWAKRLVEGLLVSHTQFGTLKNNIIGTANIADDAITATKIDWSSTGPNAGIWWEELGRTTLSSSGDTITVDNIPARNYLTIIFRAEDTDGTIGGSIRFNNDSGTNYAERYSVSNAADTTATSQTSALFRGGTGAYPQHVVGTVRNLAAEEKVQYWWGVNPNTDGAGNIPNRVEGVMKWANKVNQINRVDVINNGAGDFAIGSEVIVLGHD